MNIHIHFSYSFKIPQNIHALFRNVTGILSSRFCLGSNNVEQYNKINQNKKLAGVYYSYSLLKMIVLAWSGKFN